MNQVFKPVLAYNNFTFSGFAVRRNLNDGRTLRQRRQLSVFDFDYSLRFNRPRKTRSRILRIYAEIERLFPVSEKYNLVFQNANPVYGDFPRYRNRTLCADRTGGCRYDCNAFGKCSYRAVVVVYLGDTTVVNRPYNVFVRRVVGKNGCRQLRFLVYIESQLGFVKRNACHLDFTVASGNSKGAKNCANTQQKSNSKFLFHINLLLRRVAF